MRLLYQFQYGKPTFDELRNIHPTYWRLEEERESNARYILPLFFAHLKHHLPAHNMPKIVNRILKRTKRKQVGRAIVAIKHNVVETYCALLMKHCQSLFQFALVFQR